MSIKHSLLYLILTVGFFGCEKKLSSSGVVDFASEGLQGEFRVMTDYYSSYPLMLTRLTDPVVPQNLLEPRYTFGQLENETIHTNRTNPTKAAAVDMYLTAYIQDSRYPDFYFETPVLGAKNTLSNTTTALSWILKFSFGANKVKISKNQFDELIAKTEIACGGCSSKTNTALVNFILGHSALPGFILNFVRTSNPENSSVMAQANLNYQPPELIFAYSNPVIGKNWTISQVNIEPTTFTNINRQTIVDVVLVSPQNSPAPVRPNAWNHSVRFEDDRNTVVQQSAIIDTPLIYDITTHSAGVHTFNAQFDNVTSAPAIVVNLTISNQNLNPDCYANPPRISLRASKRFTLNLDHTITPSVLDVTLNPATNLVTSEIGFANTLQLPTQANAAIYQVHFNSATRFSVSKTVISSGLITTVATPATFQSSEVIYFDGYAINIMGTPNVGDQVAFQVPNIARSLTNGMATTIANDNNRIDQVGCFDPDFSRSESVQYQLVSGPSGLLMGTNGLLTWSPRAADYPANTTDITVTYNIIDSSGAAQQVQQPLRVLKDNIPTLCTNDQLTSSTLTNTFFCASPSTITDLPTSNSSGAAYQLAPNQWVYGEGAIVGEPLNFMDYDGDPLTVSITLDNGTLKDYNTTTFNTMTPNTLFTTSGVTLAVPDPASATNILNASTYQGLWQFRPSAFQAENVNSGTVTFKMSVRYNTNIDNSLDAGFYKDYTIRAHIGNNRGTPVPVSSTATCGGSACVVTTNTLGNTPNYFIPQYKLYPVASSTAATTQSGNIATSLSGGFDVAEGQNAHMLLEGNIATIQVPLTGSARNAISTKVLYIVNYASAPSGSSQCESFLKPGFTKVEEIFCDGSNSTTPDCLRLSFNYDPYTGVQSPVPYYMPPVCLMSIMITDSTDASARRSLFGTDASASNNINYDRPLALYFKNINRAPQLLSNLPTSFTSLTGAYPTELSGFDIRPTMNKLFYDPDLGAHNINSGEALVPVNTSATKLTSRYIISGPTTVNSHVIASATAAYYRPEVRFETNTNRVANRKFRFEKSSDGTTWNDVASTHFVAGAFTGAFIEVSTSNDFDGTIAFQNSINGGTTFNNVNVTRVDTFPATSTVNTTTHIGSTRRYLWSPGATDQLFRIQLTAHTAGVASAVVLSQVTTNGQTSSLASPTLVLISMRASLAIPPVTPSITFNTLSYQVPNSHQRLLQSSGLLQFGSRFLVTLDPADNFVRSKYESINGANFTANETAPSLEVLNDYNVDPREGSATIDCFIQDSVTLGTPVKCGSNSNINAYNGRIITFPTFGVLPINRNLTSPLLMTPSLTSASDGNFASNAQRDSKYNVILRYRDYETDEESSYTAGYCAGKTCVEHTLTTPTLERITKPTVRVTLTKQGQGLLTGAPFNLDINSTIPVYQITTANNFFEGETVRLNVRVNPFNDLGFNSLLSPHAIGRHSYNVSIRACSYMGKACPNSSRGIYEPPSDNAPASESDRIGDMLLDSDNGNPGEGNFVFNFSPKAGAATADVGGTTGRLGEYIYSFDVTPVAGSGNGTSTFTIRLQVRAR